MAPTGCGQSGCQVPGPRALPHTCVVLLPKPISLSSRPGPLLVSLCPAQVLPTCGSLTYGTTLAFPTQPQTSAWLGACGVSGGLTLLLVLT